MKTIYNNCLHVQQLVTYRKPSKKNQHQTKGIQKNMPKMSKSAHQGRWWRAKTRGVKEEICFWYHDSSFQDSWTISARIALHSKLSITYVHTVCILMHTKLSITCVQIAWTKQWSMWTKALRLLLSYFFVQTRSNFNDSLDLFSPPPSQARFQKSHLNSLPQLSRDRETAANGKSKKSQPLHMLLRYSWHYLWHCLHSPQDCPVWWNHCNSGCLVNVYMQCFESKHGSQESTASRGKSSWSFTSNFKPTQCQYQCPNSKSRNSHTMASTRLMLIASSPNFELS